MRASMRQNSITSPISPPSRASSRAGDISPTNRLPPMPTISNIQPPPAYLASSSASEIAAKILPCTPLEAAFDDGLLESEDNQVSFSAGALALINGFLDTTLYNTLSIARSPTLAVLRPTVERSILKGSAGRRAIAAADEEINELLGDSEDADETALEEKERDPNRMFDLDTVFRRTRLRVMVYTHMGELEEEDETQILEEQELVMPEPEDQPSFLPPPRQVSWSAVIFLTSIIEFLAEQCISSAVRGAADRARSRRSIGKDPKSPIEQGSASDLAIVQERDVEKVAMNRLIGKIWRVWKLKNKAAHTPPSFGAPWDIYHGKSLSITGRDRSGSDAFRAFYAGPLRARKDSLSSNRAPIPEIRCTRSDDNLVHRVHTTYSPDQTRALSDLPVGSRDLVLIASWHLKTPLRRKQVYTSRDRAQSLPPPASKEFTVASPKPESQQSDEPMTAATTQESLPERPPNRGVPSEDTADEDSSESATQRDNEPEFRTTGAEGMRPASEYDPFRFDTNAPKVAPSSNNEPVVARVTPSEQLNVESKADSVGGASSRESLTPMIEGAVASTAILGSTKAKHAEPDTPPGTISEPQRVRSQPSVSAREIQESTRAGIAEHQQSTRSKPGFTFYSENQHPQYSPIQEYEDPTPAPLAINQRKNTDETDSAYVTPKNSPSAYTVGSRASEDKPTAAQTEKDFSDLVSGTETRKRTLTPRNLREIEQPDSPRLRQDTVRDADTAVGSIDSRTRYSPTSGGAPISPSAALRSSPPSAQDMITRRGAAEAGHYGRATDTKRVPQTKQYQSLSGVPSKSGGLHAREARAQPDSTRDLADFIRSTASDQPPSKASPTAARSEAAKSSALISKASPTHATAPGTAMSSSNARTEFASPPGVGNRTKTNKLLHQPREAKVETRANQDLIAFLNQGPPQTSGTLAKGSEGIGGRTTDRVSSTNRSSSQTSQSLAESVNSRTGLLAKRSNPAAKGEQRSPTTTGPSTGKGAGQDSGGPVRKQRRVKDPYAIPDDEDDDELTDLPPKEEESLMDFLRNSEPPPIMTSNGPNRGALDDSASPNRVGTSVKAVGGPSSHPDPTGGSMRPSRSTSLRHKNGGGDIPTGVSPHDALPDFLKESRATGSPDSSAGRPARHSRAGTSDSKGMKSLFKKIGANG